LIGSRLLFKIGDTPRGLSGHVFPPPGGSKGVCFCQHHRTCPAPPQACAACVPRASLSSRGPPAAAAGTPFPPGPLLRTPTLIFPRREVRGAEGTNTNSNDGAADSFESLWVPSDPVGGGGGGVVRNPNPPIMDQGSAMARDQRVGPPPAGRNDRHQCHQF